MIIVTLIPLIVLGIAILAIVAVQQQRGQSDTTGATPLRLYLYGASLVGLAAAAYGLASLIDSALASTFGADFVYGGQPVTQFSNPTPVVDKRAVEDAVRGSTFVLFGGGFWLAHRAALGRFDRGGDALQRAYLLTGAGVFGAATVLLLPFGVYQVLTRLLVPPSPDSYHDASGEMLVAGLIAAGVWIYFLREALAKLGVPVRTDAPAAAPDR